MAMARAVVLAVMAAAAIVCTASAATYTVGEPGGSWDLSTNYANWVSSKRFHPGDQIVFKYSAQQHDVVEVNKAGFDSCSTSNAIATYRTGNDAFTLAASPATRYFICGISGHCSAGMKLQIDVTASSSSSPTPAGSPPLPLAPAGAPNANSPPPSAATSVVSSTAAVSIVALLLAAGLVA